MTSTPTQPPKPRRRWYRRPSVILLGVLVIGFLAWVGWGAAINWWDQRALAQYLAERDQRDPAWRERLYGKPLTQEQEAEHEKFKKLQAVVQATWNAGWGPYRNGLYQGMYQDPARPDAVLPEEAMAFMNAAHQFWLPTLSMLEQQGSLPRYHRYIDPLESYEKQMTGYWGGQVASQLYVLNECVEVEVMYQIARNNPVKAIQWMTYSREPRTGYHFTAISLFERMINMTELTGAQLKQLQDMVERKLKSLEHPLAQSMSDEWRLMHPRLIELSDVNVPARSIKDLGDDFGFVERNDYLWHMDAIGPLRDVYLKFRIANLFRRPHQLSLKAHHIADQIESLQRLPMAQRWKAWMQYADAQGLSGLAIWKSDWRTKRQPTEAIPHSLYLLRANSLHTLMIHLFDLHAQLQTTLAAILAERYRLATGRFPTTWEELVPQYTAAPLLDPYNGQPLRLKATDYGIVIYSIGRNSTDEGGQNLSHNHYWFYGGKGFDVKNTNLGTRVYLPHMRRGPAYQLEVDKQQSLTLHTAELLKLLKEKKD